jgi:hypothetical protein
VKTYSEKISDYISGVVVGAVITTKGHKNWKLTDRENERMVLWLISKYAKRLKIFVFAVVFLPNRIRFVVNGGVQEVANFFQSICSSIVDRMRASEEGRSTYSYCILNNFRVYTMSELNREFVGCAIAQVAEGHATTVESSDKYNSFFDAIRGESNEMTRAYAPEPVLSRLKILAVNSKFKLKYRRLPHCEQLTDEEYRTRLEKLMHAELELHRKACELALGELAAKQRFR